MVFMNIKELDTETEIESCFNLMKVLRPKMESIPDFVAQILRQRKESYRIVGIEEQGKIVALAGFRELENLIHGKFIYVDDLVTDPEYRNKNMGQALLLHISAIAKDKFYNNVVLDTGLANSQAQKFYYREGFLGLGMHFIRPVKNEGLK